MTTKLTESLDGVLTIRVGGREEEEGRKLEEEGRKHAEANALFWGETRIYTVWLEFIAIMFCG